MILCIGMIIAIYTVNRLGAAALFEFLGPERPAKPVAAVRMASALVIVALAVLMVVLDLQAEMAIGSFNIP